MALKQLLRAASELEAARQRIDELKLERDKLNARLAEIVGELAVARSTADSAIATVKLEAATVTAP